jgi:PEP-CTERM motif
MKRLLTFSLVAVLACAAPAYGAGLILNEFNAVSDTKVIKNSGSDTTWGVKTGNGGNWVELLVTTDHLNIQGWTLEWDNTDPDSGSLAFTNSPLWSDLRSGTIITVREGLTDTGTGHVGGRPTDVSYNPAGGDWWIEVDTVSSAYIAAAGFKVDNDNWEMRILDNLNNVQQDYVGESAGAPWSGGGLGSDEVGSLTVTPTAVNPTTGYEDVDYSSYGMPNAGEDLTSLRSVVVPEPSSVVLACLAACGAALVACRRRTRR